MKHSYMDCSRCSGGAEQDSYLGSTRVNIPDVNTFLSLQVSCSPCTVPVGTPVSGYALYQRHIKAMHESALLEEQRQRQEQLDMEYRSAVSPCGTSKSPNVEWEGRRFTSAVEITLHFMSMCYTDASFKNESLAC